MNYTIIVIDDRDKIVNVDKTVNVDTAQLEEKQKAILAEVANIGQLLQSIVDNGAE